MPIFDCLGPDRDALLQRAGEALRQGELVAFPAAVDDAGGVDVTHHQQVPSVSPDVQPS